jgi:monoamine oxidase
MGRPGALEGAEEVVWDRDPFARGGYAFFSASFDPAWRDALARAFGRILFAGDHTSREWQGYMNGAVESGQRAARELAALEAVRRAAG